MQGEYGDSAGLRYIDIDSEELNEFPEIKLKVEERTIEPGFIVIEDKRTPIYQISYQEILDAFERLGARKVSKAS